MDRVEDLHPEVDVNSLVVAIPRCHEDVALNWLVTARHGRKRYGHLGQESSYRNWHGQSHNMLS